MLSSPASSGSQDFCGSMKHEGGTKAIIVLVHSSAPPPFFFLTLQVNNFLFSSFPFFFFFFFFFAFSLTFFLSPRLPVSVWGSGIGTREAGNCFPRMDGWADMLG